MAHIVEETTPEPTPAPGRKRSVGDWVRFALRGIGQTLITAGVVVLLFVVYEVYVTNYFAHEAQAKVKTALKQEWQTGARDPLLKLPGSKLPSLPEGKGIAYLYIPRLGRDYGWAIVEGVSDADLEKGPGHYKGTALPGGVGNFAIAGHRVGKGEPFLNLDHLRAGDSVIVQTESKWYVYKIKGANGKIDTPDADGIAGREIVTPTTSGSSVLDAVPGDPGATPKEKLMTLTTCHPKFTASHRMIIHAVLDPAATVTVTGHDLKMPSSISGLYTAQES
jgi:sortase A